MRNTSLSVLWLAALLPGMAVAGPDPIPATPEALLCKHMQNNSDDGWTGMEYFKDLVANSLPNLPSRGAYLESEVSLWNSPKCLLVDGRPRLTALLPGFSRAFKKDKDWDKNLERLKTLKEKFPKFPYTALAEAQYWFDYAWDARGHGYASSVTEGGMKLFHDRLATAAKVLEENKSYATSTPAWYEIYLDVISAKGVSERERDKVFLEGVSKYNWYFPLYLSRASYLTPWWGGSWDAIENLALWSVEQTKATMGNALYARIYWSVSNYNQVKNVFKDTKASWPRMKQGFDDMIKQFPNSKANLNGYARLACEAGDKSTFLKLRNQLEKEKSLLGNEWVDTRLEVCDAKLGYQK